MLKLSVPFDTQPQQLKDFLRRQTGLSLSAWRKLKNTGSITINHHPASPGSMVGPGDLVDLSWTEHCTIAPVEMPLEICYEDDYLLIINKPAGLLVHPTVRESAHTLANGVLFYYRRHNLPFAYHPVHRLDKNTSGLIVIAKISHIQFSLSSENSKRLKRIYTALTAGSITPESGSITAPIGRRPDSIIERMVCDTGQHAVTHYRKLAGYAGASLVEIELLTGRTHQIRVHFSHIGHPLLGDDLYGGPLTYIQRQALHASSLSFEHPVTKKPISVDCPLPNDINLAIDALEN